MLFVVIRDGMYRISISNWIPLPQTWSITCDTLTIHFGPPFVRHGDCRLEVKLPLKGGEGLITLRRNGTKGESRSENSHRGVIITQRKQPDWCPKVTSSYDWLNLSQTSRVKHFNQLLHLPSVSLCNPFSLSFVNNIHRSSDVICVNKTFHQCFLPTGDRCGNCKEASHKE